MKKRCSKGKSCGATCISQTKVCISELPPEVRKDLLKARKKIKQSKGAVVEPAKVKPRLTLEERIKNAYKVAWDKFLKIMEETKKYKWNERPSKLNRSYAIHDRNTRFLREWYHAKDKARYLEESKKITKIQREIDKTNDPYKRYELFKKKGELELERASAYFGEPRNPSRGRTDGGGSVGSAVPSLPKGGANKELKEFLDGSELMRAFSVDGFTKFVEEGRVRNGFEAGTKGMKTKGGADSESEYLKDRRKTESIVLNVPTNTPPEKRPIYGMLENPDRSASLQGSTAMAQYGGIQVVFNSSLKDRSTFTIGDSMDDAKPLKMKASPVRDPAEPQIDRSFKYGTSSSRISLKESDGSVTRFDYVEAQIHGGVKLSDVREVRVYKGNNLPDNVISTLKSMGINVVELPPRLTQLGSTSDIESLKEND